MSLKLSLIVLVDRYYLLAAGIGCYKV